MDNNPECFEVPHNLDDVEVGEIYEIKLKNLFDPSKLWVVINFKELMLFTRYLTIYYSNEENRIKIPMFKLKKYLICIIERNSNYHRAVILPLYFSDEKKQRVFLIDEGMFVNVNINKIYYILQRHSKVPRFALRACIINIAPPNSEDCWSMAELKFVTELVTNKRLFVKIEGKNLDNKVLYIDIFSTDRTKLNVLESVTLKMLQSNMASPARAEPKKHRKLTKFVPTVLYPHLYPTIEAIEEGKVPSSLWEQELLKDVQLDVLLNPYYKYQNVNADVATCNI